MRIVVKFFSIFRDVVNSNEVALEYPQHSEIPLRKLIDDILARYPQLALAFNEAEPIILINGSTATGTDSIKDGDEIAIVPPLSGGDRRVYTSLFSSNEIDIDGRIDKLANEYGEKGYGAIAIFVGVVKGYVDGHRVNELIYEAYEPYTSKALDKIANEEIVNSDRIGAIEILHRVGSSKPGEKTLYIAVVAKKRKEAIDVLLRILERVKHEVPIFKLERRDDGDYWIVGESKRIKRGSI
ncbi:MAG: MoaD family protein [Ignisphaera sp.]|nr:MoaD family protein [Ignisphaera sp.]MCX8167492.1 MoaD family protein [Ignisphaera sp.]MDW8084644.1 MoaD family protein [Ignisphaera sp.]